MNLRDASGLIRTFVFRILRALVSILPSRRISAFGADEDMISLILVVNLDRQPIRWQRMARELGRVRGSDGVPLVSITKRISAVDARDGRAIAATADVDSIYSIGNQLYVQPDERLKEFFAVDETIKMTRQEIAVARSHIEVWKTIAAGHNNYVLVLEDDVWFRWGAEAAISRGWSAALRRCRPEGGPRLLYLSYEDAGGTAERTDSCEALFRPVRGLWFLSGYVLSREGAAALLRAMPVIGPVDLWMNYRFDELGALALSSPAILQRPDTVSDNSYSVLPYLTRAGIIDATSGLMAPNRTGVRGPVLAWTAGGERETLAMALAMLGLRVQVFDGNEATIAAQDLQNLFSTFDALVDAPLASGVMRTVIARSDVDFILEEGAAHRFETELECLPPSRTIFLSHSSVQSRSWEPLCRHLDLAIPAQDFPIGAPRDFRTFRDDRFETTQFAPSQLRESYSLDDSPWVLPTHSGWQPSPLSGRPMSPAKERIVFSTMEAMSSSFIGLTETFPGNLASFSSSSLVSDEEGTHLTISKTPTGNRLYRSGAFASVGTFEHGRFEAEIRAARGSGLVTGFFLHRDAPRQEIDVELAGDSPRHMLINVYFNPGDDGAQIGFGYRGAPCRIDLGFDSTLDFHLYAIDWRPGRIVWSVDGRIVHERVGWDPTPIPHLPMRLYANLWAPRSEELAGRLDPNVLPSRATFKNVSVRG